MKEFKDKLQVFERLRIKIFFQADSLVTSLLNHENLNAFQLAAMSGKFIV